ncbi:autotransporter domain-containing protein [Aquisalinus flavus]|uniref:Autotransporter domain-containing protein n=1 Tax=Aquisalinus flavus TaxID=1526572 RepID=A0A8J2Y423_9PROT|nr:autotransporter outer membrane beta-barrel domain-containing protein [Aquisalinus flavus]MBD0425782.1 autotransporter outer membrane beta-barrel domain-containing protein [Aquisalinus flavus]GGD13357.1 hypothetical protein GCM10011342_22610 [Aquisalinus flavus]
MTVIFKTSLKARLMHCAAASVFGAALAAATPAAAQQTLPGISPNCPIVDGEAVCEGDLEDGIYAGPGGTPFDTITIQNATTPIAPPGYFGIGVVRNTDTTITIADDIVIDVFDNPNIAGPAQGLIAIVGQGGDLSIDTGADVTANGNGSIALGIEAVTQNGDGNLDIVNRGDIEAFSSFQSAMAIQARQINSSGAINIDNSGALIATSGGTGERDFVTAGILALHDNGGGDIDINNSGAITVSSTTTDTDFNGIAAGIVTNSFVGANTTSITNSGVISATGQATHGIVGFTSNSSVTDTAMLNVMNEASGALSTDGSGTYGILVQTAGTHVNSSASNAAAITMANGGGSTGIMMLSTAQTGSFSLSNEGDIAGEGSSLRGLGIFTFDAPVGGDYDMQITNEGDITLDTPLGRGISIAATEDDTVVATVVNNGAIDMANTTDANSHGIGLNMEIIDPNAAGAMAGSAIDLTNSGDITMGSGAGIWLVADTITAENSGDIAMTDGTGMLITDFDQLALTHSGAITTTGANSDGIVVDASNSADWEVLVTETGSVTTSGPGSVGIRVTGVTDDYRETLIHETTDAVTVEKAKIADRAMNAITQYVTSSAPGNGGVSSASSASNTAAGSVAPASHGGATDVGSVIVHGTVTSDGGAGAILGEGALRVSSDNAGAVISTTGDNAPVISAQSSLYLYSDEGLTLSSTGANASLFQVLGGADNTAFVTLDHVNASTTGDGSTAFWLDGQGGDSVALFEVAALDAASPSTISTMGDSADAVRFVTAGGSTFAGIVEDTDISTAGNGSAGFNLDLGGTSSASLALADTSVTTGGANSDAVHVGVGDSSDVLLLVERSTIATTGAGSDAIDIPQVANSSVGDAVIIDSSISTTGDNASGFVFAQQGGATSSRTFFATGSNFTTAGDGSTALLLGAFGNSSSSTATIFDTTISTAGNDARGIDHSLSGDGSAVEFTIANTTISTTGGANAGALVMDGAVDGDSAFTVQLTDVDFSTQGSASDAIFVGGGGFDNSVFNIDVADAVLSTGGDDSRGLVIDQFIASQDSISVSTMDNIIVSTSGARASGIVLGSSADGAMVNSSTTVTFDNLDITTTGNNARGLQVQGLSANLTGNITDSDYALLLQNSTISTAGDNANGVEMFGLGGTVTGSDITIVSNGVDVTTTGARSDGFVVGSIPEVVAGDETRTSLALSFGTITTTGENADAIRIGAGWGSPGADPNRPSTEDSRLATLEISEDVSATGAGSDGLVTGSLINALRLTASGTLTADGFAILSQGAGGIEDLINDGTITGDIRLGDEDSDLTSAGTITGNIDMGGGANSIMIEETGVLNSLDEILLGDGNAITVAGTIAPGGDGPMQTTMIGSNLVFEAGSSYLVDISGTMADPSLVDIALSDRLEVDGSVTINGGDVVVSSLTPEGNFTDMADYRIIGGTDGVSGMFEGLEADLPFLTLSLVYNPDSVLLRAERLGFGSDAVPFASIARTPNQQAVAEALDVIEDDATGDMDVVIDQLVFSSEAQALTAYDLTSGEVYAALLSQSSHSAIASAQRLVARAHARSGEGWGLWAGASGRDGSIDGDGNAAGLAHDETGLDFGVDYAGPGNAWAVGASAGMIEGSASVSDRMSSADYDGWRAGLYARHGNGNKGLGLTAAVDYAETDADVSRDITVNALSRMAVATLGAETLAVSAEARYGFAAVGGWALGPVASVTSASSDLDAISESGADSLNLVGGLASHDVTRFGAGMFANWQGARGTVDIAAQYVDGDSDTARLETSFAGAPGKAFTVIGPQVESAATMLSANGSYVLGGGWTLGGEVSALTGNDQESVAGGLTLGWTFP